MSLRVRRHHSTPKSGQFILVWEYEGRFWSETIRIERGVWYQYDPDNEDADELGGEFIKESFDWVLAHHKHVFIR